MDLINNLVFTALNKVDGFSNPSQDFFDLPLVLGGKTGPPPNPLDRGTYYSYDINIIQEFAALDDSRFIESSIHKHWADFVIGRPYKDPTGSIFYSRFRGLPLADGKTEPLLPPYHLIYAYLVENTRIAQIFEKLIQMYLHDEKLKKATGADSRTAFQWIINTENLFFKDLPNNSYRNISSSIRTSLDATRRNAYWRMFGMDLAFGGISNEPVNFIKAEATNPSFILLFEKFLTEVWQAYTNARNETGVNTTDMFSITDTAQKLGEMLMSRRTTESDFENYRYFNLSKEEYASVVMMSWLFEAVSYDSPIVKFLRCSANTPGERLASIGQLVGITAHTKSEGLLEIAPPMNTLLRRMELGDYSKIEEVTAIILSQTPTTPGTPAQKQALSEILLIINNWEKATGHKIKFPAASMNGSIKIKEKAQVSLN